MVKDLPNVYLVTHSRRHAKLSLESAIAAALDGGAKLVQCRDDSLSREELSDIVSKVLPWFDSSDARLLVHRYIEEAVMLGAHGVHVASEDLPRLPAIRKRVPDGFLIGYTAHTVRDGYSAAHMGADFVTLGPVFDPPHGEARHPVLGAQEAGRAVTEVPCPVFVAGGISSFKFKRLRACGVGRVALSSAVFDNSDVRRVVMEYREFWEA